MRRFGDHVRRGSAATLLLGLVVGVPWSVFQVVGNPLPSSTVLRQAWRGEQIDGELAIRVGLTVFAALWAWFVLTALAEVWQLCARRVRGHGTHLPPPLPPGPTGWVRSLVRAIALSTVAVASATGSTIGFGHAATRTPAAVHTVGQSADIAVLTPLGPAHRVVPGDSYWKIADGHLSAEFERAATPREVLEYTETLMAFNHPLLGHRDAPMIMPGELVVLTGATVVEQDRQPAAPDLVVRPLTSSTSTAGAPAPTPGVTLPVVHRAAPDVVPRAATESAVAATSPSPSVAVPYVAGLGTALMVSAGAIGVVETRRRRRLRAAAVGARLAPPPASHVETERALRAADPCEQLARVDIALRAAAPAIAAQSATVLAVTIDSVGDICLFLSGAATPHHPMFTLDAHDNRWHIAAEVSLEDLAPLARPSAQPCPALVHLGRTESDAELFVDLEAVGTLSVHSPCSEHIVRALAASLAVSPLFDGSHLLTVGVGDGTAGVLGGERFESIRSATSAAEALLGSTATLAQRSSTFHLRATGAGGEPFEPAVVVAAHLDSSAIEPVPNQVEGGRGIALVLGDTAQVGTGRGGWRVVYVDGAHVVEPLGVVVRPIGLTDTEVATIAELIDETADVVPGEPEPDGAGVQAEHETFDERPWEILVRTFGGVEVVSRDGVVAACERSKAAELIVWLGHHRERPTRTGARTALWDLDVRDATFANVVSDARRALARCVAPTDGGEWITRTLSEDLPLHELVVTDGELLAARVAHARHLPARLAIEVLRPGVELLDGMPFAGTSYLWTDAEGITSSLTLLAVNAAGELAGHYLDIDDVDGVFWATGRGLKVLNGHEELIALRMRAHARRGDLAGVRAEWESYERAIAADAWASADPSDKLQRLRHDLLSRSTAPRNQSSD